MPTTSVSQKMPAPSPAVFQLLHNYSRRLEWDTLLCEARLTQGHAEAGLAATSLCVGKPLFGLFGRIGVETKYVTFRPGELAAVKMINEPPFFQEFAASIRHTDLADTESSELIYKLTFTAKPGYLRWLLHPLMLLALRHETKKRLAALAAFLKTQH